MRADAVLRLFPEVLGRTGAPGTPFAALTEAMAHLLEPADRRLTGLDAWFDPYRAPDPLIPYLAEWVDLGWLPLRADAGGEGLTIARLRSLVAEAPQLAKWRGTSRGLQRFLEVALGEEVIGVIDDDPGRPFHLVVEVPKRVEAERRLIELIVQSEKPVHLTHEVRVQP